MRFEVIAAPSKDSYVLKDNQTGTEAEIFAFGALLNRFAIQKSTEKVNVIEGYSSVADAQQNVTDGFKSAKLSPFVCRLNNGEFAFEGNAYKIHKHNIGSSAIHGLLYDTVFTTVSTSADDVQVALVLKAEYNTTAHGYPFAYTAEVKYSLTVEGKLQVCTSITNIGANKMPLNDGWHPYFKLGKTIDTAQIRFNSKEMVEFSDALLPTGKLSAYTAFNDFKHFGDTFLDNCFTLNDYDNAAFEMKDNGIVLRIYPEASYPYLQIYTPPSRDSIAVENLSSTPDSFNNKMHLIVLEPNSTKSFATTYQLSLV